MSGLAADFAGSTTINSVRSFRQNVLTSLTLKSKFYAAFAKTSDIHKYIMMISNTKLALKMRDRKVHDNLGCAPPSSISIILI